jgi:hypothetical protein
MLTARRDRRLLSDVLRQFKFIHGGS